MNHPKSGGESTLDLLVRVRAGDARASDELVERYLPELRRWTSGRLPLWARHAVDTDDLIQDTLIEVFRRINTFEYRGDGALLAYLRQALMNRIRNQIRAAGRRPPTGELDEQMENAGASPLEAAIGSEALVAYDTALCSARTGAACGVSPPTGGAACLDTQRVIATRVATAECASTECSWKW